MKLEIFLMGQNNHKNDDTLDVGPVTIDGFPRHKHRWRCAEEAVTQIERVLYAVQRMLVRLTH